MHTPPRTRFSPPALLLSLLAIAAATPCAVAGGADLSPNNAQAHRINISTWEIPALAAKTAGGFACQLGDAVVLAAAAEAPETADLWYLDSTTREWVRTGIKLARGSALAADGGALYSIGGETGGAPVATVLRIGRTGAGFTAQELPELPVARTGAGAAVLANRLFVFSGRTGARAQELAGDLWSLDLADPAAGWRREADLPAAGRARSTVVAQNNILCVFGGEAAGADGITRPTAEAWIFRIRPREGTLSVGWERAADLPEARTGASALPVGQTQVMLAPGRDAASTTTAAGGLADRLLLYHTVTDSWAPADQPLDLAAALLLPAAGNGAQAIGTEWADGAPRISGRGIGMVRSARRLAPLDLGVIAAYFVTAIGIGVYFSRRQKSGEGYALGNRNMKWWATGISMFATGASAISFMAIPAQVFGSNLIWLFPLTAQIFAFPIQAWVIFPLLRRLEITSTYEYLERRFNATLRLIASAQSIVFQTLGRMTIVMVLPALAISATTGIPVIVSVVIMGFVTTLYTSLGGISAVIWTDVLQGTMMLLAPLFVIVLAIAHVPGGWSGFVETGIAYHKFDFALVTWDMTLPAFWLLFLSTFLTWTVQAAGDQPMIQKIFASPLKDVRRTAGMLLLCGTLIAVMVQSMGISIFAYFHHHPAALEPAVANDQIVPFFIVQRLPVGVAGLVIAAIFAAAVSTLSGTMISVATLAEQDFFLRFMPGISEKSKVRVLRYGSYTVGLAGTGTAAYLSTLDVRSIWDLWNSLAALLGGGVVGVYTLGMFTRRANGFGAIGGALLSIVVTALFKAYTPFHWATFLPVAIGTCVVSGYLLSFLSSHTKDLTGLTIFTPAREGPADRK